MLAKNYHYIHSKCQQLPQIYKTCRIHIALELADENKDWASFKIIYKFAPDFLKSHIDMTNSILEYNYLYLSEEEQQDLFSLN